MGGAPGGSGYGAISPNRLNPGDVRQFSRELRSQREAAEGLRRELRESGRGTQDLDRLIQRLRAIESEKAFNDPEELSRLRSSVVEGFKEFEFGLRRELGDSDASRPVLGGGNDVPAGYREMVNEYFRSLTRKPRP